MTHPQENGVEEHTLPHFKTYWELCFPGGMVLYKDLLIGQQTELRFQMYVFAQESFLSLPRLFNREKLSLIKCTEPPDIHMQ